MLQSVKDRKNLTEKWMRAKEITNQHVMVQIGGAPLPDVLDLVKKMHFDRILLNKI